MKKWCSETFHKIHRKTPEVCNFIKREALAQVFSCEFCEISKSTFFTEHSGRLLLNVNKHIQFCITIKMFIFEKKLFLKGS